MFWTIVAALLFVHIIINFGEFLPLFLPDSPQQKRERAARQAKYDAEYQARLEVKYGAGAQPRELFPSLSNRQVFLRVCLVLGVGFVICTGIVGVPVVKNAVQTERLERQRIAFVDAENNLVGDMTQGHSYRFTSEGDVFIVISTEPIYPDTPERLLRENVLNVPWKCEQLKQNGFRAVNLGYATVVLP